MRKEYDLREGRPNPYGKRIGARGQAAILERFLRAEHFVRIDADLAEAFSDDLTVNEALRLVLQMKGLRVGKTKPPGRVKRSA